MFINEGSKEGNHDEVFWVTLEFLWLGFRLAHTTQGSWSPTALPISPHVGYLRHHSGTVLKPVSTLCRYICFLETELKLTQTSSSKQQNFVFSHFCAYNIMPKVLVEPYSFWRHLGKIFLQPYPFHVSCWWSIMTLSGEMHHPFSVFSYCSPFSVPQISFWISGIGCVHPIHLTYSWLH